MPKKRTIGPGPSFVPDKRSTISAPIDLTVRLTHIQADLKQDLGARPPVWRILWEALDLWEQNEKKKKRK